MRGKLKFSFLLILSVLLLGCTKSTKEIENRKEDTNDNITDISNETTIEIEDDINIVEFKKNDVDLNGYELKQTVEEDINNDGIEDTIELWIYRENTFYAEVGCIKILDGNSGEVLTNVECGMGSYEIKSIADINGDKVKDICISCNDGGNAVSWSEIYEYRDKVYSMLDLYNQVLSSNMEIKPDYNFCYYAMDKETLLYTGIQIPEDKRAKYINVIYDEYGAPLRDYTMLGSSLPCELKDMDNDGVSEILNTFLVSGNCHADTLLKVVRVIKYIDGEYKLIAVQQDDSPLKEVNTNLSIDEIIDVLYEKCNFNIDTVKLTVPKEGSVSKELVDKIKDKYYYFFCSDCFDGVNYVNRDYLIMVDKDTLQTYKYSTTGKITPFISD